MAIKRALMNPTPSDFEDDLTTQEETEKVKITRSQMKLDINTSKNSVMQLLGFFKLFLRRRNDFIEVSQFWKTLAFPLMIVTSVFNILLLFIGGLLTQDSAPNKVQLFYDSVSQTWAKDSKVDFSFVFILPIFLTAFLVMQYRFTKDIFKNDRRLAKMIAWIISFLNLLLLVAIIQIYKLIN